MKSTSVGVYAGDNLKKEDDEKQINYLDLGKNLAANEEHTVSL